MKSKIKILIAQGGGPTMVINQSLVAIIQNAKKANFEIYGSINGVNGIINNRMKTLTNMSNIKLTTIANLPGAFLGSTRDKPDKKYCKEILKILKYKKIEKFFYIGGNDSSDSLRIISEEAEKISYGLQCIHVPKTIDNDLVMNDHTPGFGSAAKYVANLFAGINLDINSLPGIYVGVIMGRHAGFLTASSSLLRKRASDGPHLIYLPESEFRLPKFYNDIQELYNKYGKCIIAVSEGIKDNRNELISSRITSNNETDAHGNVQLSGSGALSDYLANQIKNKLKIKRVRADTLGYAQRSFPNFSSEIDQKESFEVGKMALRNSLTKKNSFSIGIIGRQQREYKAIYGVNELGEIAGKTKYMPKKFINKSENGVTKSFANYATPLIGKNLPIFT